MPSEPRSWVLRWDGQKFTPEQMTLGHALAIGAQVGFGFEELDPWRSTLHLSVFLAVFIAAATGERLVDVSLALNARPLAEVLGAISEPEE